MNLRHLIATAASLVVMASSTYAFACDCLSGPPKRGDLYAKSTYVFLGTVSDLGAGGPEPVTITVDRMYKGDLGDREVATIPDPDSITSCNYFTNPRVGEPYLFFTSNLDAIETEGCHPTIFGFDVSPPPENLDAWIAEDGSAPPEAKEPAEPAEKEVEEEPADEPGEEPGSNPEVRPASGGCATSSQVGLPTPPVRSSLVLFVGVFVLGLRRRF
jgi:hypothetical protein